MEENICKIILPDPKEAKKFWSDIWSESSAHNQHPTWLQRVRQKLADVEKQGDIKKAPGPDDVQGFWFKKIKNLHDRLARLL